MFFLSIYTFISQSLALCISSNIELFSQFDYESLITINLNSKFNAYRWSECPQTWIVDIFWYCKSHFSKILKILYFKSSNWDASILISLYLVESTFIHCVESWVRHIPSDKKWFGSAADTQNVSGSCSVFLLWPSWMTPEIFHPLNSVLSNSMWRRLFTQCLTFENKRRPREF